ncbi:MAG: penicillin-binding protein 2 [Candidatus Babeliaceae bacterium]|jgi:cell division protein FtsI/penicillin-binding protein 2
MTTSHKTRLIGIFFGFLLFFCVITANLIRIQYFQQIFFKNLAQTQYLLTITEESSRGEMFDRYGKPLAVNTESTSAFITPSTLKEKELIHTFLKQEFPQAYQRLLRNPYAKFMYIKRKLSPEELLAINNANLKDINMLQEKSRLYPYPCTGIITGMTDIDNNGLFGIELSCNTLLKGAPTIYLLEKEARSRYFIKKEIEQSGVSGNNLTLTIDRDLQFLVHEELKNTVEKLHAKEGSVIIMDPLTGDIITMVHYPDYTTQTMHDISLTKNSLISNVYEFGSVMKIFPALAALEEHLVTPDEIIDCENTKTTYIDGVRVNTWKAHGAITYAQVIECSNNIGTSKVTQRLGPLLYDHLKQCGFGQKTHIALPGEQKGFINPPERWSNASLFSLSFGYEINATLLQLAQAFCMIANGGYIITPKILLHDPIKKSLHPIYSDNTITTMRTILTNTINHGTAYKAKIDGYTIMGKTGTANLLDDTGEYNKHRNIFTFICNIEKGTYKRVIGTFIKEIPQKNVFASTTAVPLGERVAHTMLIHDKII